MGTLMKELIKVAKEISGLVRDCRTLLIDIRALLAEKEEK